MDKQYKPYYKTLKQLSSGSPSTYETDLINMCYASLNAKRNNTPIPYSQKVFHKKLNNNSLDTEFNDIVNFIFEE